MDKLLQQLKEMNSDLDIINVEKELGTYFRSRQLHKNETLLSFDSICRSYYFINKGALRIFFIEFGKEYTSWFAFENYFFTELESYTRQKFSKYNIIATEDTEVLEVKKSDMEILLSKFDWWKNYLLFSQQTSILKLVEAVKSFQTQSAKQRYEDLFIHADFIQRTKQKDLSTMLGVTRHSLSRIRKK